MELVDMRKRFDSWFDSEEGQKSIAEYLDNLNKRESVLSRQLHRLFMSGRFVEFTRRVVAKYESDEYRDRWYSRGIEPREDLYYFLMEYAIKYGRKVTKSEIKKYGNIFTSELVFCEGFYFNLTNGQGSVIKIIEQN
jgi:hypothetical protein